VTRPTRPRFPLSPRLLLLAFSLYALTLFLGTHWPGLRVDSTVIQRPDLFVHLSIFGTWAALLLTTGLPARLVARLSPCDDAASQCDAAPCIYRTTLAGWVIAAVYAAIDESSQAIPALHRTAAWDDYAADLLGVTLGCLVWAILLRRVVGPRDPRPA